MYVCMYVCMYVWQPWLHPVRGGPEVERGEGLDSGEAGPGPAHQDDGIGGEDVAGQGIGMAITGRPKSQRDVLRSSEKEPCGERADQARPRRWRSFVSTTPGRSTDFMLRGRWRRSTSPRR